MDYDAQKARTYLKKIIKLRAEMQINLLEQESLYAMTQGCNQGVRVQTSPKQDAVERAVEELETLKDKYGDMLHEWLTIKATAGAIIDTLDVRYRGVLRLKYCAGMRLETIADELHYSLDHVKRLHRMGLSEFGKKMPPNATL